MTEAPVVQSVDANHAFATWRNLAVLIWRDALDVPTAEAYRAAVIAMHRRFPEGSGGVHVVESSAAVPGNEVRRILADVGTAVSEKTFVAVVAEGQALRSSLVRGITTGVALLVRNRIPIRVFSTVPEAATWVSPQVAAMRPSATPGAVVAAVESIRARIG